MRLLTAFLIVMISLQASASAERILVMDTLEFETVRHEEGKWRYVTQLTKLLQKLRLKEGDFDAMNSDRHVVKELILQRSKWKPIMKQIDAACQKAENKKICIELENSRLATFEFIKNNPESIEEVPAEEAVR